MAQAAIAHREGLLAQLLHDRPDDARTGENDLRPLRLKTDDGAAGVGIPRPVEFDLAFDLGAVEHAALDDRRIIVGEPVLDRGDVSHRATHRHQRGGNRTSLDARQVRRNRRHGPVQHLD